MNILNPSNQLTTFIIFILTGILIAILFDIFRILRKSFKTPDIVTYIEDIIFWILTGTLLIYTIFKFNNGAIRLYIFIGLFLGVTIYILLFSKSFIKVNLGIINFIKGLIQKLITILIFPIKLILSIMRKIFLKPISFIIINIRKNSTNFIKKQKNMFKNIKKAKNKTKNRPIKEGF